MINFPENASFGDYVIHSYDGQKWFLYMFDGCTWGPALNAQTGKRQPYFTSYAQAKAWADGGWKLFG